MHKKRIYRILQSVEAMEDKIVASALEVKSSVSENNISNENPEELDGDLTESDEDEETMQKELERLQEEANQKSKLLDKQKTAEWLHSKADEAKRDKDIFFTVPNVSMVSSSDLVIEGTLDVAKDIAFFTANHTPGAGFHRRR